MAENLQFEGGGDELEPVQVKKSKKKKKTKKKSKKKKGKKAPVS